MLLIDTWSYASHLRPVNAYEKFFFAVITLITCIASRTIVLSAVILLTTSLLTLAAGRIPTAFYLKLLRAPLLFLLLSGIVLTTQLPLIEAARITAAAMGAISCLYFLALSTPMTDIMQILRRFHCPALIIELMIMLYRFLFVLSEQAYWIRNSQRMRLGYKDRKTSLRSAGLLLSMLLVRSLRRADILYDSMESRCYQGRIEVLSLNQPHRISYICLIAAYDIILIGACIWMKLS